MADPTIIESAARAIGDWRDEDWSRLSDGDREWYRGLARIAITVATPLIEAAALEKAAKFVEDNYYRTEGMTAACDHLSAAIRALKENT